MNNRFKFRVWDKVNDEWMSHQFLDIEKGLLTGFYDETRASERRYILMQCTGLKDKNGKLIYEGDIVEYKTNGDKCEIIFDQYQYMAKVYMLDDIVPITELLDDFGKCPFEVIGNIYENKALLESEVTNDK